MTENEAYYYIIGLGSEADWQAGRGSLYYIEGHDGKRYMPVFTTPKGIEKHMAANFNTPKAHMEMLESLPVSHVKPLTEGRFIVMPVDMETLAQVALERGVDYLIRDPRPGHQQEFLGVKP